MYLLNTTNVIQNFIYIRFGIILTQFYLNFSRQKHQIDVLLYILFNSWDSQVSAYTPFHFSSTVPLNAVLFRFYPDVCITLKVAVDIINKWPMPFIFTTLTFKTLPDQGWMRYPYFTRAVNWLFSSVVSLKRLCGVSAEKNVRILQFFKTENRHFSHCYSDKGLMNTDIWLFDWRITFTF